MNFQFERMYDQALINYRGAMKKYAPFLGSEELLSVDEENADENLVEAEKQRDAARRLFFGV